MNNPHEGHVIVMDESLNWSVEHPLECREGPVPMSQCPTSEYMRHFYEPPVDTPGRYEVGVDGRSQMYKLVPSDRTKPRSLIDRVAEHVRRNGGIVITYSEKTNAYFIGSEWGAESDDSPMAGAAAYGADKDIMRALRQMLDEAGVS